MKKLKSKIIKITIVTLFICTLMYIEYRYIMININPSISKNDNNTLYLEVFNQVDEYNINE